MKIGDRLEIKGEKCTVTYLDKKVFGVEWDSVELGKYTEFNGIKFAHPTSIFARKEFPSKKLSEVKREISSHQRITEIDSYSGDILDLESNLLSDWNQLENISHLTELSINGNRFTRGFKVIEFPRLTVLAANRTMIDFSFLTQQIMPNLTELYFCSNSSRLVCTNNFDSLQTLFLIDNGLEWKDVSLLSNLNLVTLNLNENNITEIIETKGFIKLQNLFLDENPVIVESLDNLRLPQLNHLTLRNTGIESYQPISRIKTLKMYNGSSIEPQDRIDNEVYFLSKVSESKRHQELIEKYGERRETKIDPFISVRVGVKTHKLPRTMEIRELRSICPLLFGCEMDSEMKLHDSREIGFYAVGDLLEIN